MHVWFICTIYIYLCAACVCWKCNSHRCPYFILHCHMHISRLSCRCYRLLYPFSAHQTEMTHSPFEGRWQGEGRKTKGGRVKKKKKRQQIWILLRAMAEFRRSLERRTDSDANNKMAAFHQRLFHTEKKRQWWDMCLNLRLLKAFRCGRKCPGVGWHTMRTLHCAFSNVTFLLFWFYFYL